MLKLELMQLIVAALSAQGVAYGLAEANTAYPLLTYSFVASSLGNFVAPSFGADTESFLVQFSVFDDQTDGERMLELLDQVMGLVVDLREEPGVVEVRYSGGTGPTYLDTEREWRCTADYRITMARDTPASS